MKGVPLRLGSAAKEEWDVWRLLTSPRLSVSLSELRTSWTFHDFIAAHHYLDALEEAEAKAHGAT